jgi:hypothetical protein
LPDAAAVSQNSAFSVHRRGVRFEGERMVLIPPPRRIGESEEHREIIWERIAAE